MSSSVLNSGTGVQIQSGAENLSVKGLNNSVRASLMLVCRIKCSYYGLNTYIKLYGEEDTCDDIAIHKEIRLNILLCGQVFVNRVTKVNLKLIYDLFHDSESLLSYYSVQIKGECPRSGVIVATVPSWYKWSELSFSYRIYGVNKVYKWIVFYTGKAKVSFIIKNPNCSLFFSYRIAPRIYPTLRLDYKTQV